MELQVDQAAQAGSQKDTKEKARGDTKKNLGTSFPEQGQQYQTWGWSTVLLLEHLSLIDVTQGAGTEPLLILHSPQAAQLGWHSYSPKHWSCWKAALARNEIWALNEWETKGQLTSGSS